MSSNKLPELITLLSINTSNVLSGFITEKKKIIERTFFTIVLDKQSKVKIFFLFVHRNTHCG